MEYKIYVFCQNNSGGSFASNSKVAHEVWIQADSTINANDIAKEIGIYFDGCKAGIDCECCGDRWFPAGNYDILTPKKFERYSDYKSYFGDEVRIYLYGMEEPISSRLDNIPENIIDLIKGLIR